MPEELISTLELDGIRIDAEQLFEDACTIVRPVERATFDRETEVKVGNDDDDAVYSGRCSIYPIESRRDRFDEFGQGLIFTRQYRVVLPWTVADVQIRDIVTVTTSADPQLVNRPMEVRDVFVSTNTGYRRLTVHDSRE